MVAGEAATTTMGALTMPDAADQVPDELSPQVDAVKDAITGLAFAAYGKGLRDGIHASSRFIDGMAALFRGNTDQFSELVTQLLDSMRDRLRISAHETTMPDTPGGLS